MEIGGFQKSLLALLDYFDYKRFDVDLFLIHDNGIFVPYINQKANIFSIPEISDYFYSYITSVKKLFKKKKYKLIFLRTINLLISTFDKGIGGIFMSKMIPEIDNEYDVCVDYNGQYINYYMIDKINAKKKITFFHNNYSNWNKYKTADKKYYKYSDWIVTVSDDCVSSLKMHFPEYSDKIIKIENIVTIHMIEKFSCIEENNRVEIPKRDIILCTVGRVCHDKGIDIALNVANNLKKILGNKFVWIWVGPGEKNYIKYIFEMNLDDVFLFTGKSINPYYYMKNADIIVQPSRFEGKAVSIEEAMIMNKPVIATNYPTVHNQIINEKNGIIVDFNAKEISEKILYLTKNKNITNEMSVYQSQYSKGNEYEIDKFLKLIK